MNVPTDIVFSESYVLGISIEPYLVRIAGDFVPSPSHPKYTPAGPKEQECYRRGEIRIRAFERLVWEATGVLPSHDSSGEFDFGNLDELEIVGDTWRIVGDWGVINITGGTLYVELFAPVGHSNTIG